MVKFIGKARNYIAGLSHVLVMFISVVSVAVAVGLDPALTLLTAGIGTLLFYFITKKQVPIFLGSSFAFIGILNFLMKTPGMDTIQRIAITKGSVMAIGLVYVILAVLIGFYGVHRIRSLFPTIVTSPLIIVMGLKLCQWAVTMMVPQNFEIADGIISAIVIFTMIVIFIFSKGLFSLFSILLAMSFGIVASLFLHGPFDLTAVHEAKWIGLSENAINYLLIRPNINLQSILVVVPFSFFVIFEHIGDIAVLNAVTSKDVSPKAVPGKPVKDFYLNPGLDKTLLGNGVATMVSGFLGGPVNTTYSENASTLEITKVQNPKSIAIAAVLTIILALLCKMTALISAIPTSITAAISLTLYAFITACGFRTFVATRVDLNFKRNMIICSTILVFGMVVNTIKVYQSIEIPGVAIACLIGILLNKFLPEFK